MMRRCWGETPIMIAYHDNEWGVPLHDDRKLFEFLVLQGMQAGLSWSTILNKRENFRAAFSNFDARKVANYDAKDIRRLMKDAGIIRNRLKLMAAINNSKKFLDVQRAFGSFGNYIWAFVGNKPVTNKRKSFREMPAWTELSDKISAAAAKFKTSRPLPRDRARGVWHKRLLDVGLKRSGRRAFVHPQVEVSQKLQSRTSE